MKVGDTVPVTIGGHVVAQAVVRELSDGTATLIVPATRVVMGVRVELGDLPDTAPSTEHVVTGVDGPSAAQTNTAGAATPEVNVTGPEAPVAPVGQPTNAPAEATTDAAGSPAPIGQNESGEVAGTPENPTETQVGGSPGSTVTGVVSTEGEPQ